MTKITERQRMNIDDAIEGMRSLADGVWGTDDRTGESVLVEPACSDYDDVADYLEHYKKLQALLQKALACLPVAADCPEPNVNLVEYTDEEWVEICGVTQELRQELAND